MGNLRRNHSGSPTLQKRGENHRLPGKVRQKTQSRLQERHGRQHRDVQESHAFDGRQTHRRAPEPHGHGVREERRRRLRLHDRPDTALHRRRMGEGARHDARCRRRHRHGHRPGTHHGRGCRASRPRSVIYGGRGDGPYRCVQPRQRHALGPLPHQPRLGRRRRDFHRLRRRRRYGSDFPLPRRTRPGRDDLDAGRPLRSQRRPFGRQHQRRTRQLQQAAHAPAAGRNGTYGPASGLVRRG